MEKKKYCKLCTHCVHIHKFTCNCKHIVSKFIVKTITCVFCYSKKGSDLVVIMENVAQYTHCCQNKVSKLPVLSISCWVHLGLHCVLNPTFSGWEFYTLGLRFLQLSKHTQGLNRSNLVLIFMLNVFLQKGRNSYAFFLFCLVFLSYSPGCACSDHEGW